MPANIMLPTNAKITALVCSGRNRPKVSHGVSKLSRKKLSCDATSTPTNMPTIPQTRVASRNWRTILSLNSRVIFFADIGHGNGDGEMEGWRDGEMEGWSEKRGRTGVLSLHLSFPHSLLHSFSPSLLRLFSARRLLREWQQRV